MKLLILGNHTCGNRGDSAILRGLLDAINTLKPETEVDVMSRYPVSSSWLLNRPVMGDPLYSQMKQHNNAAGVMGRVKKVLRRRYQHQVLLSLVTDTGKLLSACDLTLGTRLHSAIISMNFGTPAIAINYEHKSAGIMQQLGMPEMAVDIRHLLDGSLGAMVGDTLGQLPAINERLAVAVKAEREKGIGMVKSVLDRVREGK